VRPEQDNTGGGGVQEPAGGKTKEIQGKRIFSGPKFLEGDARKAESLLTPSIHSLCTWISFLTVFHFAPKVLCHFALLRSSDSPRQFHACKPYKFHQNPVDFIRISFWTLPGHVQEFHLTSAGISLDRGSIREWM
jgi:hypothetical protein